MHSDASKRFSCFIGLRATGKQLVLECVNNWWWIGFSIWQSIVVVSDRRAWRSQHTHTHTHKWLWEKLLCGLCVSISTKSASHHMKLRKEIVLVWFQMCSTWLLVGLFVSGVEIVFFCVFILAWWLGWLFPSAQFDISKRHQKPINKINCSILLRNN